MTQVNEPIRVHAALDSDVNIGPIPGSQIWYWAGAMIITIIVCKILSRGWPVGFPLFAWMASTSWILTGKNSWIYLNRFHKPQRYIFAGLTYEPFLKFATNRKKDKPSRDPVSE